MVKELPAYLSLAADVPATLQFDVAAYTEALLSWWRHNQNHNHPQIPTWAKAARMVFSMQCSSAASERVFSLVESMYRHEQHSALADQLQAGVMLLQQAPRRLGRNLLTIVHMYCWTVQVCND